ncbi:MAG: hypothetical protein J5789_00410 [Oscillospiraceae bacterium]|nr:hypothetical protein [Oscillospiraceae bacterium]
MKTCPQCGYNNPNVNSNCASCGEPLPVSPEYKNVNDPGSAFGQNNGTDRCYFHVSVRFKSGGLIAWAILTMLLCVIPGVIALVFAVEINNSYTYDEQYRKLSLAKGWCAAGTILGLFGLMVFVMLHG